MAYEEKIRRIPMSEEIEFKPIKKSKLFLVQDEDCSMWVLAATYTEALSKWKQYIVEQSDGEESILDPNIIPKGIQHIADEDEIIK